MIKINNKKRQTAIIIFSIKNMIICCFFVEIVFNIYFLKKLINYNINKYFIEFNYKLYYNIHIKVEGAICLKI